MKRILEIFKINPGEERMSTLLVGLMLLTSAGSALGGNAVSALFFNRFGVESLPVMYMLLGMLTFMTSMGITIIMGRFSKKHLFTYLPVILGMVLLAGWITLGLGIKWIFAVMWLGMNVIGSLQGVWVWGLAGAACDTRQAKRLFPLFSAGGILGAVLGGFLTPPLAGWLHSETLVLLWAGVFLLCYYLGRTLVGGAVPETSSRAGNANILTEMQRGYQFVRRSSIMQWVSYSAFLFSLCYFFLDLQFSRGASARFPSADQLAGFLGLFQSINTIIALIVSLFLANRLFARFGIMPMLLLFPVIYLLGFGVLSFFAPFPALVSVRFLQMVWMQGIAGTAWQTLFNVVPANQRDQVRTFIGGAPEQLGVFAAGLLLFLGDRALNSQQLNIVALFSAAALVYVIWRASKAYGLSLVDALREGQPQIFFSEEQPFGGFHTDAAAVSAVLQGADDPDVSIRRASTDILGHLSIPEARTGLVKALDDTDAAVRISALRGLTRLRDSSSLQKISASLSDPEPEVRFQTLGALREFTSQTETATLEPLLADADFSVRARAASILLSANGQAKARTVLHEMATHAEPEARVHALSGLGECKDPSAFAAAVNALEDADPSVRKAAAATLALLHDPQALGVLVQHLNDSNSSVRKSLAEAIALHGSAAFSSLMDALSKPECEDGALTALEASPLQKDNSLLRAYAENKSHAAARYFRIVKGLASPPDDRMRLLVDSLTHQTKQDAIHALHAVGLLKGRSDIHVALSNLQSHDPSQRANALEVLESIGEAQIVRPLLHIWEAGEAVRSPLPADWLSSLLNDPSPWLRACAVLASAGSAGSDIRSLVEALAANDADPIVRSIAMKVLTGVESMDALATLPVMERILFLRRVPLFADLAPADLKQVAAITVEAVYSDGDTIVRQGETGDEMYIIVSGDVSVRIDSDGQPASREIARRIAGDYVGEMAIISREPRIATLVAVGSVRVLCLDRKQFEGILHERPEIGLALMRILCERLKEASNKN